MLTHRPCEILIRYYDYSFRGSPWKIGVVKRQRYLPWLLRPRKICYLHEKLKRCKMGRIQFGMNGYLSSVNDDARKSLASVSNLK